MWNDVRFGWRSLWKLPWFTAVGGADPFPDNRGKQPVKGETFPSFPITCLVRREAIGNVSFGPPQAEGPFSNEDYHFWIALFENGAKFYCAPEITWAWNHWGGNTSGRGDRWA